MICRRLAYLNCFLLLWNDKIRHKIKLAKDNEPFIMKYAPIGKTEIVVQGANTIAILKKTLQQRIHSI